MRNASSQLPPRVTIAQPRPMAGPAIAALSMLATVGIMGVLLGLGPWSGSALTASVATSSPPSAGGSSAVRFGPNAEVALIALATRYAETPAVTPAPESPGPLVVWIADTPTPTPYPPPPPATATVLALRATATAAAKPQPCDSSPSGRVCFWPTPTPVAPTATAIPICHTPVPKQKCVKP